MPPWGHGGESWGAFSAKESPLSLTSSDLWGGGGKRSRTPKVFHHVLLPGQKVTESSALIMAPQTLARKAGDKVFGCLAGSGSVTDITLADSEASMWHTQWWYGKMKTQSNQKCVKPDCRLFLGHEPIHPPICSLA